MNELSVVLISRNQEWNIARLIESVLRETQFFAPCEIILVDSASTDRTTEIAAQYPISVLKLASDQRLTAAAGRYVGYKHTTGELVLFLDGDMELCAGWLEQAYHAMNTISKAAVICGQVINCSIDASPQSEQMTGSSQAALRVVKHGGGAALYRRRVLDQVGSFNPYLYSDEEPELCLRIRHQGYLVVQLLQPIAWHYTAPAEKLSTFLEKRKGHIWIGYGQNIRYLFRSPLLWPYLVERGWALAPGLTILLGVFLLIFSGLSGQWTFLGLWLVVLALLLLGITIQKRSLKRALLILLRRLLILDGTLQGLLLSPLKPATYPGKFEVIR